MSDHQDEKAHTDCPCGHAVMWHHERRGCGYHGYSERDRCRCRMTAGEVVMDRMALAWNEGANAAIELHNTGTRMTLRARIPFPADENPYLRTSPAGGEGVSVETVDLMLGQLERDRETPYWGEHPHVCALDGAEAWLLSLRDWLRTSPGADGGAS